jgi:hypothetical protein
MRRIRPLTYDERAGHSLGSDRCERLHLTCGHPPRRRDPPASARSSSIRRASGGLRSGLHGRERRANRTALFERMSLIVLGPPADFVFLMKLFAARAVDYDDMVALWPSCSFGSADDAVSRFHAAYPHVERDPHLSTTSTALHHRAVAGRHPSESDGAASSRTRFVQLP